MMEEQKDDVLSYQRVLGGLLRMHQLFLEGKRRSEEVDRIRDELDEPYAELTTAHRAEIEGLSRDLFDVEKNRVLVKKPNVPQAERFIDDAIVARDEGRLDLALELLRKIGDYFPFSRIAFLRASVWKKKGNAAVTLLFLKHALDLEPADEQVRMAFNSVLESIGTTVGAAGESSTYDCR